MSAEQKDDEAIFSAALEKGSAAERAAYLDGACGDDADLRARVEALLRAHDEAGSFLDRPAVDPDATVGVSTPTEGPGTKIGRYKLLQRIGEGGFGVVYMAEQEQPVRRKVALKIIKLGMDTKQVIGRFEAERQALAMMDHPNIARVFDAGATETGRPYFVMELVKGIPITDYCDQNNVNTKERLDLFMPVCNAVQHAHQKGIIHRDIKPSNVMVTLHDGKPVAKVIDFGIAKATHHRLTEKTVFTEYGRFIGTPQYMSPEQAEMSGLDVDTRTDIYSLGVLLYELLTGTTPFDAEMLRHAAYGEIQRIIREVEPPKPSTRLSTLASEPRPSGSGSASLAEIAKHRRTDPSTLSKLIRGDLDWIVMKALEKDRTRRYETAKEFAKDVEHHLANEPLLASPPGAAYKLRKFVKRNRVAVTAGTLVAAALLLGLMLSTIGLVQASRQRQRAEAALEVADQAKVTAIEQRERAEANEARATAAAEQAKREGAKATLMLESLQEWLVASVRPNEGKGEDLTVREMLDEAAEKIESQFADQSEIRAALLITIGRLYSKMYIRDRAEQVLGKALEIRRELFGADSLEVAEAFSALCGLPKTEDADIEQALEFCRKAIAIREKLLDQDDELLVWNKGQEATLTGMLGRWDEWIGILSWYAPLFFSQFNPNEFPNDTRDALVKARQLWEADDLEGAVATMKQHAEKHILAKTRNLWATGKHEEARELVRRIYTPFLDRPLYRSLVAHNLVAISYWRREQGEGPEGWEPLMREAVVVARDVHGDDSVRLAYVLTYLGHFVAERRDFTEAEALLKQAVTIYRNQVGDEHPERQYSLDTLLGVLRAQGKTDEARTYVSELLARRRRAAERPGADADVLNRYARTLLTCEPADLRDPEAGLQVAKTATAKSGGNSASILDTLALSYKLTGDLNTAIETEKRALDLLPLETSRLRNEIEENLVKWLEEKGDRDAVEQLYRDTLRKRRSKLPEGHRDIALSLVLLGKTLVDHGKHSQAELLLLEGLALWQNALPEGDWLMDDAGSLLGASLAGQGRFAEAEPLLVSAYSAMRDNPQAPPPPVREALEHIVKLYDVWGKPDKAAEYRAMLPAPDESSTGESGGP